MSLVRLVVWGLVVTLCLAVCLATSGCLDELAESMYWTYPESEERLTRVSREAMRYFEEQYGHLPMEDWPEHAQQSYANARKYIREARKEP